MIVLLVKDEMPNIIFLSEIYESRRQKERELDFYRQQMEMLQQRMDLVKKEIIITDTIITIIEKEIKK